MMWKSPSRPIIDQSARLIGDHLLAGYQPKTLAMNGRTFAMLCTEAGQSVPWLTEADTITLNLTQGPIRIFIEEGLPDGEVVVGL